MARVLIVDDSEDARMMLGKMLAVAGYETLFAANGWEALLTLDNTPVDLVLLDLMMPGMDGKTFLRILRQGQNRNLPVAIITALDYGNAEGELQSLRVDSFLTKNEDMLNRLLPVVETAIGSHLKNQPSANDLRN